MVKIPYMEAGIVIMTDFSIVEKQKSANFGFCPREGGDSSFKQSKSAGKKGFKRGKKERERKGGRRRKAFSQGCYPLRGITSKQLKQ